jgi:uncharacterized protein (TIGR03492 family)
MKLLCLSNGHGEDAIARRVVNELQRLSDALEIQALPIVGEGRSYRGIPIVGPVKAMPSGGFIYMDGRQLARDLQGGLVQLTVTQLRAIRQWAKTGDAILAVGDIVPLLFAYLSGLPYAFVGTARSEYYLRDETGLLPRETWWQQLEGWSGSVYHPWERWLLSHSRCKAVFPRDGLTAATLQQFSVPAFNLGNPMMDDLAVTESERQQWPRPQANHLTVVLLPGSRAPEAYENWQLLVTAIQSLMDAFPHHILTFLGAIAPNLSLDSLQNHAQACGWALPTLTSQLSPQASELTLTREKATLHLSRYHYKEFLYQADLALAMAGTATEQFIGLGKLAIGIPGKGPQFTARFAEAQARLLGPSLQRVQNPSEVGNIARSQLNDSAFLKQVYKNGHRRMGSPGAAQRIAEQVMTSLGYPEE